jgi:hypothetical protein
MACLKRLSILFLFSSLACAQYIPVYAKLTDGTGNVSKTAYLHFELQNCGSNFPIVPGNSQVAPDGVRHQEIRGGLASGLLRTVRPTRKSRCAPSAQGMQALPMVLVVPSPILECDPGPGAFVAVLRSAAKV